MDTDIPSGGPGSWPAGPGAAPAVSQAALDFLLIEVVPLAQRIIADRYGTLEGRDDDVDALVEGYGFRVGRGLSEVFTRDRARFADQLDVMKFVCKDLWVVLYKKQVDNLKTNHRGTFVLVDNAFRYTRRMSTPHSPEETARRASPYLWFPCGVIRGVLAGLGIPAKVAYEVDAGNLSRLSFNIQTS